MSYYDLPTGAAFNDLERNPEFKRTQLFNVEYFGNDAR